MKISESEVILIVVLVLIGIVLYTQTGTAMKTTRIKKVGEKHDLSECPQNLDYFINRYPCNTGATNCAIYDDAKKSKFFQGRTLLEQGCHDPKCKFENGTWSYKDRFGNEYYYYPDQKKCRSYVNGQWSN